MSKRSVLLIEDNQDDYEALLRAFKAVDMGVTIDRFVLAEKALGYLKDCPVALRPSMIILDLNMPGLDGRQFLTILKESPDFKQIPVVILTTSVDEKDVVECYGKGANTYMQKPVRFSRMKELCEHIKEYWFNAAILPLNERENEEPQSLKS